MNKNEKLRIIVKAFMQKKSLTMVSIAREMNWSNQSFCDWLNGRRGIPYKKSQELKVALRHHGLDLEPITNIIEQDLVDDKTTFEEFDPENFGKFDKWKVTDEGHLVTAVPDRGVYEIYKDSLDEDDWFLHLMTKAINWNSFIPAYLEACKRAGIKEVKIKTTYDK